MSICKYDKVGVSESQIEHKPVEGDIIPYYIYFFVSYKQFAQRFKMVIGKISIDLEEQ